MSILSSFQAYSIRSIKLRQSVSSIFNPQTKRQKKRLVGIVLIGILLTLFLSLNRIPKLDQVQEDLAIVLAPKVDCFQGFCIDKNRDTPLLSRWWDFSIKYFELVTIGMLFAFLVAGVVEVFFLPSIRMRDHRGGRITEWMKGILIGSPLNLCSGCIVPVANAYRNQGATARSTVGLIQSSTTLNPIALIMLTMVFSPVLAGARIIVSLLGAVVLGPLVESFSGGEVFNPNLQTVTALQDPEKSDTTPWKEIILDGCRDLARATLRHIAKLGPGMVLAGLISGLIIQWISPEKIPGLLGDHLQGIAIAATLGVMINVPLLFEIPLVVLFLILGAGVAPAAALLFTAAAAGPVTFAGMSSIIPKKAVVAFAVATWILGIFAGLSVMVVDEVIAIEGEDSHVRSEFLSDDMYTSYGSNTVPDINLMVTIASSFASKERMLNVYVGIENNKPHPADLSIIAELIVSDEVSIPMKDYSRELVVNPHSQEGALVEIDIAEYTDKTGEMALRFILEENGAEIARKTHAFVFEENIKPLFTDVTIESGFSFEHNTNPRDEMTFGNGLALDDYDQDGFLDIYVTQQVGGNALFRNNGDGTFSDLAVEAGVALSNTLSMGAVFGDYNNDGERDLYVLQLGPNVLFRNNGNGTFTEVTAEAGVGNAGRGISASWGDYDSDGYIDLYVTNHTSSLVEDVSHVRLGTDPANDAGAADVLYHNNGDGTFDNVTEILQNNRLGTSTGFAGSFVDYDNDNDLDIYLVNDVFVGRAYQGNILWRNDGSIGENQWQFTDITDDSGSSASIFGMGLAIGDYDNNGFQDMFMSNIGRPVLYHNNGDGTFRNLTNISGLAHSHLNNEKMVSWGVAFFDYDNDGWLDTYIAAGNKTNMGENVVTDPLKQPNALFHNNQDGTFVDVSGLSGANSFDRSRIVAIGDYDNDGCLDIFVGNYKGSAALYRNECEANNWLAINTEGVESNRDGIGVKIRMTSGGMTQLREIRSGGKHGTGSEIGAYFGLGSSAKADIVEINWPSGRVEHLFDVPANQKLHIVEKS